jgi:hypothetical protein
MNKSEILQITAAIITLTIIIGFQPLINLDFTALGLSILFSFIILASNILGKKIMSSKLDADVEHQIWRFQRYGLKPKSHLNKSIPLGVIAPLFITIFTLGSLKLMTLMSYETKALKRRAAKRHGTFSFTEMTDFHNALVGASGIVAVLVISFLSYFVPGFGDLTKYATFYAFFNLIPFSKLDGTQIFFGSRVLWATLAVITLIFTAYALLLI